MPNETPRKTPDRTPDDRDDDEAPETPPTEPPPQPIEDPPAPGRPPYVVTSRLPDVGRSRSPSLMSNPKISQTPFFRTKTGFCLSGCFSKPPYVV